MKLWKISQSVNNGYDTYDSAVVAAETEEIAKRIHPARDFYALNAIDISNYEYDWAKPQDVKVEYLGEARNDLKEGVIVFSFNAG